MSYIDDVQFIEGSIDIYQEICAELARLNQRKTQQAEVVTNCLLPLLQNLLDVWEAKAPHYTASFTEFFGEQEAKEALLQAQRRFLPTTAQGVCLRRETVGDSLVDVGFLGETTSCSPLHLYFQFAGESRYEMSIPLEIMNSFCVQEDMGIKGRQQVFADWLDSLMNQNRIRPLPVLETDLPQMIAASCSLFNVSVPQPGTYVVTGRQANNRHGEKGWHHYFGYVVQVRMRPDAKGGPIVLIRHPDGQLGCHVNQTYSLLKGIWLKKAKECFPPGLSPEAEDYTRPFYYKGGRPPLLGELLSTTQEIEHDRCKTQASQKVSYEEFYDYDELVEYVEHKLGYPLRDTLGSFKHFDKWCDFMGYGWVDPKGKARGSSQVWFAEYQAHPEGEAKRPEYRDFWHWLIDQYAVRNGSLVCFELREDLESLPENKAWVKEILECMIAEFGEEFNVFIEW